MENYISREGQQFGPYTEDDLLYGLQNGNFSYSDMCWREGMQNWQPLSVVYQQQTTERYQPQYPLPAQQSINHQPTAIKPKKRRSSLAPVLPIAFVFIVFYFCLGIFVVQPIGAIPDGATIVYWRFGLELPFISSADGYLEKSGAGVSILGRGIFLAGIANKIKDRKIVSLPYSRSLYLWSTGGKEYRK